MKRLALILITVLSIYSISFSFTREAAYEKMEQGDFEGALADFQQLALKNDVIAYYVLAQCYDNGYYLKEDTNEAFKFYRKAAERGYGPAQKKLSEMYYSGRLLCGVDLDKGTYWERKSQGNYSVVDLEFVDNCYKNRKSSHPNQKPDVKSALPTNTKGMNYDGSLSESRNRKIAKSANDEIGVVKKYISFIDENIPIASSMSEHVFALIIANENYHELANAEFAINDGESFYNYCRTAFGIPEKNIRFVKDATLGNLKSSLSWAQLIGDNTEMSLLLVYYSGHGFPDEKSKDAYLVPIDGFVSDLSTCISLEEFYNRLGNMNFKSCKVFLDACFSGSNKGEGMLMSARGVAIKPKPISDNMPKSVIVFSACRDDETAMPYEDERHGLFTFELLKAIKSNGGDISMKELSEIVSKEVRRRSAIEYGKSQTPTLSFSEYNDSKDRKLLE